MFSLPSAPFSHREKELGSPVASQHPSTVLLVNLLRVSLSSFLWESASPVQGGRFVSPSPLPWGGVGWKAAAPSGFLGPAVPLPLTGCGQLGSLCYEVAIKS